MDLEKSRAYEEDAKILASFAKQKEDAKNKSVLVVQIKGEKNVDGIIENAAKKMISSKGFTISQNAASASKKEIAVTLNAAKKKAYQDIARKITAMEL